MDKFEQLEALVAATKEDARKFYEGGNKAAGTRVRKAMQDIKNLAQEIRVDVQNKKNEG
ncbi:MAG: histone H1 [Anaerolineae bacterium]